MTLHIKLKIMSEVDKVNKAHFKNAGILSSILIQTSYYQTFVLLITLTPGTLVWIWLWVYSKKDVFYFIWEKKRKEKLKSYLDIRTSHMETKASLAHRGSSKTLRLFSSDSFVGPAQKRPPQLYNYTLAISFKGPKE